MKKTISALFFLSMCITCLSQEKDPRLIGLDATINAVLKEWNVPGASVAIVEKNKVLLTKGFGYREYDQKIPATENTQFAIGSATKAFTASLISYLIKDFDLDLDAPVINYFPELRFYNSELTENLTMRDMLCHRSGLPRHDYAWYSGGMGNRDSMVMLMRYLEPSARLRQKFQYNNLNYVVLAKLIEKNYHKSWEQLVQERLFSPLKMSNSTTGSLASSPDHSNGYVLKNGRIQKVDFLPSSLQGSAPVGGIVSTAKDMANWLLMWTNGGSVGGKEIISSDFYQQAISAQMIVSPNLPSRITPDYYFFNYGFGWYNANYRGHYGVGHGGNINGFSSFVSFFPTDSIGIFVSVNRNNSAAVRVLSNTIADKMIMAPAKDWNAIFKKQEMGNAVADSVVVTGANPSHPLQQFEGVYQNNGYGTITIKEENGMLTGTFNRWALRIKHLHHNYFRVTIDADVFDESNVFETEFTITPKGDIGSVKIPFESEIPAIEFNRKHNVEHAKIDYRIYTGSYNFSGTTAKIYLSEKNILKALIPGQPEYDLIPVRPDEFEVKGAKGVIVQFERDAQGNIPGCVFIQPNGKFRVTRIQENKSGDDRKIENPGIIASNDQEKFAGEYDLKGQIVKIIFRDNKLIGIMPGQGEYLLTPSGEGNYVVEGLKDYTIHFNTNKDGRVKGFVMRHPNGKMEALRK